MQFKFQGKTAHIEIDPTTTISQLRALVTVQFDIDNSSLRLLSGGKSIKPDDPGDALAASVLNPSKPVMILAQKAQKLEDLHSADAEYDRQVKRREAANATLAKRSRKPQSSISTKLEYTFGDIKALPYGNQEGALRYLQRIRDDKAVQALMSKYKLSVGLLTELDPFTNTEIDHRKLGLNENAGQVIRLRIRTDDYEGFCNYNEILLVLCHELAHNYHQDHSPKFWETCRLYEKEIKQLDPWKGGHSLQ